MPKRCTCGTVVADLERRRVLDLLPGRTAETLAGWPRAQPAVEAVARDRSTEHARLGARAALQAGELAALWPTRLPSWMPG